MDSPAATADKGRGPVSVEESQRVRLRLPRVATPTDGYVVGWSRLAGQLLFTEVEPLAAELHVMYSIKIIASYGTC